MEKLSPLRILSRFVIFWLSLSIVLGFVLWFVYYSEANTYLANERTDKRHVLQLARETVSNELSMLQSDVLYLSNNTILKDWLDTGNVAFQMQLKSELLAFTKDRHLYDQVRFIDNQGNEVIRINLNNGKPSIVSDAKLQNKSTRYYFRKSLSIPSGSIYVSPFDLNIEQHVIEQPIKPIIRLGRAVVDSRGRRRGIIVLNYLGQRLLDRLKAISVQNGSLWLLNQQGYWLIGPSPKQEWGFMYSDRKNASFANAFIKVWPKLKPNKASIQLRFDNGLFNYLTINPWELFRGAENHQRWILMTYTSNAVIAANLNKYKSQVLFAFMLIDILLAVVIICAMYFALQRNKAANKLREGEARFRNLIESAPDAIIMVDKAGYISLVNSQAENWFGYQRDELLGQSVDNLVPERFRNGHAAYRNTYAEYPVVRPMGGKTELFGLRKDGSEFPVEISLSPIHTEQGLMLTSIVRDISERKHAEKLQQQTQTRYRNLVNNLPLGMFRAHFNPVSKLIDVNPAFVEMFDAPSVEALETYPVLDLYRDPEQHETLMKKILKNGAIYGEEIQLKTLNGHEFVAAVTAVVKRDLDGTDIIDGIVEDITSRKVSERRILELNEALTNRSQELESTNKELEAFCYSVSHDLRAPLRAMDGFSHSLLTSYGDRLDEKGKDRLTRVRNAAQRMAGIIDDLLKLSRISRTELHSERVDLSLIANEVMETLRQVEPERVVNFTSQPDLITKGDARLLRVAMDNLLGNALKFTGQRADASIEVGGQKDGDKVVYYVKDNGVGFDMAYSNNLFGPFQRLHQDKEFPGTGIGLATVQRVINKHGGRIWAESKVDKGTIFYFTLEDKGLV